VTFHPLKKVSELTFASHQPHTKSETGLQQPLRSIHVVRVLWRSFFTKFLFQRQRFARRSGVTQVGVKHPLQRSDDKVVAEGMPDEEPCNCHTTRSNLCQISQGISRGAQSEQENGVI